MIKQIKSSDIKKFIQDNPNTVLLDVRTEDEWNTVGKPETKDLGIKSYFITISQDPIFLETIKNLPLKSIIFTDINKDGMKQGINIDDTLKMAESSNIPVTASGGVSSIDDIKLIKSKKKISGVVVGKAIYDGLIDLNELVKFNA